MSAARVTIALILVVLGFVACCIYLSVRTPRPKKLMRMTDDQLDMEVMRAEGEGRSTAPYFNEIERRNAERKSS